MAQGAKPHCRFLLTSHAPENVAYTTTRNTGQYHHETIPKLEGFKVLKTVCDIHLCKLYPHAIGSQ
jgi:hypothetical protein